MRLVFTILLIAATLSASADKTTRKGLKAITVKEQTVKTDSINTFVPSPGMIRLSGYDKPLRSYKESIYATNATRRVLSYINIEITYFDESGRQMHKRNVKLNVHIPEGETRQITFSSWDKQRNLYYIKSGKPRTSDGTPYSISAQVIEAAYGKE
ncbi:MAG: hypothetical protein K2H50_01765 [Paramuribaculum sp.]|nr:hypothetical protein [Paramuribaculum sp.]